MTRHAALVVAWILFGLSVASFAGVWIVVLLSLEKGPRLAALPVAALDCFEILTWEWGLGIPFMGTSANVLFPLGGLLFL